MKGKVESLNGDLVVINGKDYKLAEHVDSKYVKEGKWHSFTANEGVITFIKLDDYSEKKPKKDFKSYEKKDTYMAFFEGITLSEFVIKMQDYEKKDRVFATHEHFVGEKEGKRIYDIVIFYH